MAAARLKIKVLSAAVRVNQLDNDGKPKLQLAGYGTDSKPVLEPSTKLVFLARGDELPESIAHGELDRLKEAGAVGTPEEVARYGDAVRSAAPLPPPAEPDTAAEPATLDTLAEASPEQLIALMKDAKVGDLIDAVGNDAALAQRVLEAESSATSGDERPKLKSALDKVIEGGQAAAAAPAGFVDLNAKLAAKAVAGYDAGQLDAAEAAEKARTGEQSARQSVLNAIDKRREAIKNGGQQ